MRSDTPVPHADAEAKVPDLLSVLLQQRDEQATSDMEEEALAAADHHLLSDQDDSDEEAAGPEDPSTQEEEDAIVRAQLRDANQVISLCPPCVLCASLGGALHSASLSGLHHPSIGSPHPPQPLHWPSVNRVSDALASYLSASCKVQPANPASKCVKLCLCRAGGQGEGVAGGGAGVGTGGAPVGGGAGRPPDLPAGLRPGRRPLLVGGPASRPGRPPPQECAARRHPPGRGRGEPAAAAPLPMFRSSSDCRGSPGLADSLSGRRLFQAPGGPEAHLLCFWGWICCCEPAAAPHAWRADFRRMPRKGGETCATWCRSRLWLHRR